MAADPTGRLVLLFGGFDDAGALNDTWTLESTWSQDGHSVGPSRRAGAALGFDPSGAFLLFGGGDGRVLLGDTWTWGPYS